LGGNDGYCALNRIICLHGAKQNQTLQAIYYASLGLARELGMHVVAEGLEDKEEWDLLRDTGCDLGQGYFIARPMPAESIPAWIKTKLLLIA
jgi:EAL domain-containing protein (putative c-di-GMP-specific phosphodiesterase class I)